eukprot:gnl/TRDRNA2_/TRDRNA2_185744_c0_seq1.p1 gnl/TRDRNA2_/TRDRNA2_185744_c0~~gnl/TRDRNA2_/TRDRNA2_185744_c0_seq1.p1  ORF type:complete len:329 (-),score=44.90 gnl/TRDRNA2_/TRDRNA2_185744_c0_seq1:161-1147(-)
MIFAITFMYGFTLLRTVWSSPHNACLQDQCDDEASWLQLRAQSKAPFHVHSKAPIYARSKAPFHAQSKAAVHYPSYSYDAADADEAAEAANLLRFGLDAPVQDYYYVPEEVDSRIDSTAGERHPPPGEDDSEAQNGEDTDDPDAQVDDDDDTDESDDSEDESAEPSTTSTTTSHSHTDHSTTTHSSTNHSTTTHSTTSHSTTTSSTTSLSTTTTSENDYDDFLAGSSQDTDTSTSSDGLPCSLQGWWEKAGNPDKGKVVIGPGGGVDSFVGKHWTENWEVVISKDHSANHQNRVIFEAHSHPGGEVSSDCSSIAWENGSTWTRVEEPD